MLAREYVEITGERDAGQQVGEEDIDGAGHNELIEGGPVGEVTMTEVLEILLQQPAGLETRRDPHGGEEESTLVVLRGSVEPLRGATLFLTNMSFECGDLLGGSPCWVEEGD